MSHTIRGTAVRTLGQTDELVSAKGTELSLETGLGSATGVEYFDEDVGEKIDTALAGTDLVDGVTPAIIEQIAVQALAQRQTEPRVTRQRIRPAWTVSAPSREPRRGDASRPRGRRGLPEHRGGAGGNRRRGDAIVILQGKRSVRATVADVVRYEGSGPTARRSCSRLRRRRHSSDCSTRRHILVSNRGDEWSGAALTDEVVQTLAPCSTRSASMPTPQAGRARGGRRSGQHLHGVLHDVRLFLDRWESCSSSSSS